MNRAVLERVLARLQAVRRSGNGWMARCPSHEDRTPSLAVRVADDGRVLLHCHAGCSIEAVLAAVGLRVRDLFPDARPAGDPSSLSSNRATAQPIDMAPEPPGCTVAQYARAKRLPERFLRELGLGDITYQRRAAVRIPYLDSAGDEAAVRFRTAISEENGDSGQRFRWRRGSKPMLYGLDRLSLFIAEHEFVIIVEGESDCHTLWLHGYPAIGLPGAAAWREEWATLLDRFGMVYVVVEQDDGGDAVLRWLARSRIRDRARIITLAGAKDPSELFCHEPEAFRERWQAAMERASPWSARAQCEQDRERADLWAACEHIATRDDILGLMVETLGRMGVVGEERVAKLIYLALTGRLLARPPSLAIKGPSSAGKSYLIGSVLRLFPAAAYYALSAMSERSLAYSEEPLEHRTLVLYEAAGIQGDFGAYLVRSLLSEGCVRYETVEKTKDGFKARLIQRPGPTGLIITTTAIRLHPENETRVLSVPVTDGPDHTRRVLERLADEREIDGVDVSPWHALQSWLERAERRVTIPYAGALAAMVPPVAVRMRRDFSAVLTLIQAHAVLHQARRERDGLGRIVATIDDYAAVRELVADLVACGVEASVPTTVREAVAAVRRLSESTDGGVTVTAVGALIGIDKSAASRRVRAALERGYLRNLEDRRGRPLRLVLGDPLPGDVEILPSPESLLSGCAVARLPAGQDDPPLPNPASGAGEVANGCELGDFGHAVRAYLPTQSSTDATAKGGADLGLPLSATYDVSLRDPNSYGCAQCGRFAFPEPTVCFWCRGAL
jgi:hypothetical protein